MVHIHTSIYVITLLLGQFGCCHFEAHRVHDSIRTVIANRLQSLDAILRKYVYTKTCQKCLAHRLQNVYATCFLRAPRDAHEAVVIHANVLTN